MDSAFCRTCLPLLFLLGTQLHGDPIQLQATDVYVGPCSYVVKGVDFSFIGFLNGPCQSYYPEDYPPDVFITQIYLYVGNAFYPDFRPTIGTVTVSENPGRLAVLSGLIVGPAISIAIPVGPVPQVSENTFLVGSLSVCLLPYEDYTGGPCDPAYANFATINVNVAGSYVVETDYRNVVVDLSDEGFSGTSAAVPEPSSLALFCVGLLWCVPLGWRFVRRRSVIGRSSRQRAVTSSHSLWNRLEQRDPEHVAIGIEYRGWSTSTWGVAIQADRKEIAVARVPLKDDLLPWWTSFSNLTGRNTPLVIRSASTPNSASPVNSTPRSP